MGSAYDIVVVGLGHAGCEAALAASRLGLRTAAVTLRREGIGLMSCNPAIGGTAKGHLVRELDALGGEMGRAADLAGTHFKTLNASKGPAVRATRVLCDRVGYAGLMRASIEEQPQLCVIEAEVCELLIEGARIAGVRLADGSELQARAVVLTTGTFLQAVMHLGSQKTEGGRHGEAAARGLSESLRRLGFELGRFKTGTPPRLKRASIDFAACEVQPADRAPRPFSSRTRAESARGERFPRRAQVSCYITHSNAATHRAVFENLSRSPLYQGEISGRGPRYCPSFEDKVVRFAERPRHQVFLEPEGVDSEVVYPAGLSTSLPPEVQDLFLRTMPGLEEVEVLRHGYAVEYDYAPPTQLRPTLETRRVAGLFFAGQLNGTSGYEEAAFQGLMAGLNAALQVKGAPALVLGRHEAHGGVLLDELCGRGVDEPFRMLTSRSEHRLRLREGNAELRLCGHRHRVGLGSAGALAEVEARRKAISDEVARLARSGRLARLRRPEVTYEECVFDDPERPALSAEVREEVEVEVKYAGYIAMADRAAERGTEATDGWSIPGGLDFGAIRGLSREAAEKLQDRRPQTVGQARRVPGVTPAAVTLLMIHLRRQARAP